MSLFCLFVWYYIPYINTYNKDNGCIIQLLICKMWTVKKWNSYYEYAVCRNWQYLFLFILINNKRKRWATKVYIHVNDDWDVPLVLADDQSIIHSSRIIETRRYIHKYLARRRCFCLKLILIKLDSDILLLVVGLLSSINWPNYYITTQSLLVWYLSNQFMNKCSWVFLTL